MEKQMSRRTFLKSAALAGGAALIAATQGEKALRYLSALPEGEKSPEVQLQPNCAVIDFFDIGKTKDAYIATHFPQGFSEAETFRMMGVSDATTPEGLREAVPQTEDEARLLMINLMQQRYARHGTTVVTAMQKTAEMFNRNGEKQTPVQLPLTEALRVGSVSYDEEKNPTLHATIDSQAVEQMIARSPESVINMSFELGDFSATFLLNSKRAKYPEMGRKGPTKTTIDGRETYTNYQGETIGKEEYDLLIQKMLETELVTRPPIDRETVFMDGYAGEKTYDNLKSVGEMAKKFPQKLFVIAGGNPTYKKGLHIPDIRAAREQLQTEGVWSENIIVVGVEVEESGMISPASYGADIYVKASDLEKLDLPPASSFATPVVTEAVRQLITKGIKTPGEIKTKLGAMTENALVSRGAEDINYKILNLQKAIAK